MYTLKNFFGKLRKRNKPYLIQHPDHNPSKSKDASERYYRTLLMLYLPWRIEDEILNGYESYEASFNGHSESLEQMMAYHGRLKVILEAKEKLAEQLEKETVAEEDQDGDDELNAVQGRNIPEFEHAMEEVMAVMAVEPDNDIACEKHINSLNDDQKRIFDKITSVIVHQEKHIQNNCFNCSNPPGGLQMFISGEGGVGKTFLIQTLKEWVNREFPSINGDISVCVCAPTGLAALSIGGVTIHKLLSLPVEHGKTAEYNKLTDDGRKMIRNTLKNVKLIILDEVSLVSSLMLTYIHLRLCEISGLNETPFGGFNIVLLGDLLQLVPVKGDPVFMKLTAREARNKIGAAGSIELWKFFDYDELTINVRQAGDTRFLDTLKNIRIGKIEEKDLHLLNSRLIPGGENLKTVAEYNRNLIDEGQSPVCLFPKVAMFREYNDSMLKSFEKEIVILQRIDELDGVDRNDPKTRKEAMKLLDSLATDVSRTAGVDTEIQLCLGAQVMLKRNLDVSLGLVNGTMGVVTKFVYSNSRQVSRVGVQFQGVEEEYFIERVKVRFQLVKHLYVHRQQFPLVLSYGVTVHKSQGLALKSAIMNLGSDTFGSGMSYVALSRVKSLDGLHLLAFDANSVSWLL